MAALLPISVNMRDEQGPPCRCEFVHRWLDAHLKYFPPPPIIRPITRHHPTIPRVITRMGQYTYGQNDFYYFYSQPIPVQYPLKDVKLPYIMNAPYRISPMKPIFI